MHLLIDALITDQYTQTKVSNSLSVRFSFRGLQITMKIPPYVAVTVVIFAAFGANYVTATGVRGRNHQNHQVRELEAEDIMFWTRVMEETGSIPPVTTKPTKRPTVMTFKPTSKPVATSTSNPTVMVTTTSPTAGATSENPTTSRVTANPTAIAITGSPSASITTANPTAITTTESPTVDVSTISPTAGATSSVPSPIPTTTSPTPKPTPVFIAPTTPAPTFPCNLTPEERARNITELAQDVSNPADIATPGSPQQRALDWIINEDAMVACPSDMLIQRYVLAVFYYSTDGDNWKICNAPDDFGSTEAIESANQACNLTTTNATAIFPDDIRGTNAWLSPDSECLWGGVSCYPEDSPSAFNVNVIEFEDNDIGGTLPFEMQELTNLRFFALERGGISGPIPEEFGNFPSLLLMDFDFNNLSGTIPDSIWTLPRIRQLDLNDNALAGTLATAIGNLEQLRFFQIDNNNFEGTIPSEIGNMSNMGLLGFSGNLFTGSVPSEICGLRPSPLRTLVVDCTVECSIPDCCTDCA
mmetsp:Transcript_14530/g.30555  ORF Transcript_14530/g.30555 Transcript_14530/m.30555 type:complete len:529 (+) Transcript_14530:57-1643(+)